MPMLENRAWVQHRWGGLSGYVRVTATFEPAKDAEEQVSEQRINVNFQQRFLGIQRILGIQTPWLDPMRVYLFSSESKGTLESIFWVRDLISIRYNT